MRWVTVRQASPGDACWQGKESVGADRGGPSLGHHPVMQGGGVEGGVTGDPAPQRGVSGVPPMSTAALARSLELGRRALPPAGRLRTLGEVADYLGVSIRTVRRLIGRGELRAHRVGRSLRVQDAELAAYVAASMEQ